MKNAGAMDIMVVVQARMGSTRLPGKVLRELLPGRCMLDLVMDAVSRTGVRWKHIVIATTELDEDQPLVDYAEHQNVPVVRGDSANVLNRFLQAAADYPADAILRVCADNPLLDPDHVRALASAFERHRPDYAGYVMQDGAPAICTPTGLFAECVSIEALAELAAAKPPLTIAEHVTLGIFTDPQRQTWWLPAPSWSQLDWLRLTCDTSDDLARLQDILTHRQWENREALVAWLRGQPAIVAAMRRENEANPKPTFRVALAGEVSHHG